MARAIACLGDFLGNEGIENLVRKFGRAWPATERPAEMQSKRQRKVDRVVILWPPGGK